MLDTELLWKGLLIILNFESMAMTLLGVTLGILVGSIPGLTTTMGMALMLPLTYFMSPLAAIPFLLGLAKGGMYGGSIPAILLSTPGTGAAVATLLDGYPLAKKGQARLALETALFASATGDFLSDVIFILCIAPLTLIAMHFSPPEYFALYLLSLTLIASVAGKSIPKGFLSAAMGVVLGLVGIDTAGNWRFTFGIPELSGGIPVIPLLIGLFAMSTVFENIVAAQRGNVLEAPRIAGEERLNLARIRRIFPTILRSTAIGTIIGAIPAIGGPIISMLGYAAAKRFSKNPEEFGHGSLEGIAGPEAANNAANGPTMIPLLTFGIPGDTTTAVLLGAFMAHGLRPGPQLFQQQGDVLYAIFMGMLIANFFVFAVGYISADFMARLAALPSWILLPTVFALAVVGSYAVNNSFVDVIIMGMFGFVGCWMKRHDIPMAPMVITLLLTHGIETNLVRSLIIFRGDWTKFLDRPIVVGLLLALAGVVLLSAIGKIRRGALKRGDLPVSEM